MQLPSAQSPSLSVILGSFEWKWVDGSALDYDYWTPNEPNGGDNGFCAYMWSNNNWYENGHWDDTTCTNAMGFLCQKNKGKQEYDSILIKSRVNLFTNISKLLITSSTHLNLECNVDEDCSSGFICGNGTCMSGMVSKI